MPSNIPVGYAQATFSFLHEGSSDPLAITLGITLPPGPGAPTPQLVANQLQSNFAATVLEDMDNGISLTHTDLFVGAGDGPSGSVRSDIGSFPGERAMVSIPLNTAVLVNKTTPRLGRLGRGRMFVPSSVAASEVSEVGRLGDSIRTSLNGSWSDFWDLLANGSPDPNAFYSGPLVPVLIHQPPHDDIPPTSITGFEVAPVVGTRGSRIR